MESKDIYSGQIFLQHCGDSIKVIEKTSQKRKEKGNYLYKGVFLKYHYEVLTEISNIKEGKVMNPQIEQIEFIDKLWPQHCGDTLKVIKKTDKKNINSSRGEYLYECEFIKYPYKIYKSKGEIKKGTILNPRIEIEEFLNKIWPQNCGDDLKVIKKVKEKINCGNYLYECEFIKYPNKVLASKTSILRGNVVNSSLPWKTKEGLKNYIKNNFKEKPTLIQLSNKLGISRTHLSSVIITFGLKNYIHYYLKEESLEGDLVKSIKSFYKGEIILNSSRELNGKEIDVYFPNIKLGVEFNGNYWHCEELKLNNYHQEKSLLAKEKNIFLIHIFEYEWLNKKEILSKFLKNKCGIFDKKIFARKCKIKKLSNKEYQDFCDNNHLQGQAGASVKLGLFYSNELVQVMSFGSPRFTDKYDWEIIRECSKLGYCILGGKKKLWSYFIKKYNPKSCISYCDFSKFNGKSYLELGFKFKQLNKPGFVWYNRNLNETYWRNPYHNKEMQEKGYLKIYDCGQLVFIWER